MTNVEVEDQLISQPVARTLDFDEPDNVETKAHNHTKSSKKIKNIDSIELCKNLHSLFIGLDDFDRIDGFNIRLKTSTEYGCRNDSNSFLMYVNICATMITDWIRHITQQNILHIKLIQTIQPLIEAWSHGLRAELKHKNIDTISRTCAEVSKFLTIALPLLLILDSRIETELGNYNGFEGIKQSHSLLSVILVGICPRTCLQRAIIAGIRTSFITFTYATLEYSNQRGLSIDMNGNDTHRKLELLALNLANNALDLHPRIERPCDMSLHDILGIKWS
jgi:hypothetical protein